MEGNEAALSVLERYLFRTQLRHSQSYPPKCMLARVATGVGYLGLGILEKSIFASRAGVRAEQQVKRSDALGSGLLEVGVMGVVVSTVKLLLAIHVSQFELGVLWVSVLLPSHLPRDSPVEKVWRKVGRALA